MSEFRKEIIRSSSITDDIEQEEDFRRLDVAQQLLNELLYVYYGHDASFLPYTHDEIESASGKTYKFNPDAANIFIDELLNNIDEQYWLNYPLPDDIFEKFNEDTKHFYRSFLYLAIRISSIKLNCKKPEGHHEDVGNGTFKDLLVLAKALVIPYSEAGFHRRYEIGIQDSDLPQIFFDIQKVCHALGKEDDCFLHASKSSEEQENAYREDSENELNHIQMIADANGLDIEQLQASQQYLKESNEFLRKQEEEALKKQLADFEDADTFIQCASTYRDLLFRYNNHDTEQYIDTALKLFLLRNNLSALSTESGCKDSHNSIIKVIESIRDMK